MSSHRGKKVGVWLSVLVVLISLAIQAAGVCLAWHFLGLTPLFLGVTLVLLAAAITVIAVAIVRIREINGGEEDDLSQY